MSGLLKFLSLVVRPDIPGGCWEWRGRKNYSGYAMLGAEGKNMRAHRYSWQVFREHPGDKHVLHSCDNRGCVNPKHLFLGTHQENMQDRNAKGRSVAPRGEANGNTKLTSAQVLEIRQRKGQSTRTALAAEYGVSRYTIGAIHEGRIRKYDGLPEPTKGVGFVTAVGDKIPEAWVI